jgi:hypothetical protein
VILIFRSQESRFSIWDLRDDFTDVLILCENGRSDLKAHKIVLAAVSPLFRMKVEKSSILVLPEHNKADILSLLEFIYKGETTIQFQNYQRWMNLARDLSITSLRTIWDQGQHQVQLKRALSDTCIVPEPINKKQKVLESK